MPGICSNYGLVFPENLSWRAVATKIHSCAIPKTRNLTHTIKLQSNFHASHVGVDHRFVAQLDNPRNKQHQYGDVHF